MVSQHGAGGQRLCPANQKSVSDVLRRSGRRTTVPVRCASFRLVQGRRTRFRVSFTFCGVKERQRTNLNLLQVGDFLLSPRRARKQRDWHRRLVSVKNTSRIHWWRKNRIDSTCIERIVADGPEHNGDASEGGLTYDSATKDRLKNPCIG
ncbi:uncharacterized protein LOC134290041 [Aedes albopictus]|uniref:Secreted protein n=1 Tax=Aedes albopictus TaxID=7160 RepID=A0ABM1ZP68_AEDAL